MDKSVLIESLEEKIENLSKKLVQVDVGVKRVKVNEIYLIKKLKFAPLIMEYNLLKELGVWDICIHYHSPSKTYHVIYFGLELDILYKSGEIFIEDYTE